MCDYYFNSLSVIIDHDYMNSESEKKTRRRERKRMKLGWPEQWQRAKEHHEDQRWWKQQPSQLGLWGILLPLQMLLLNFHMLLSLVAMPWTTLSLISIIIITWKRYQLMITSNLLLINTDQSWWLLISTNNVEQYWNYDG